MVLTIKINMDNAAFDENAGPEVDRILEQQNFSSLNSKSFFKSGFDKSILIDINGNKVGVINVTR